MSILWLKAFHLFFMVAWMAGLFYLPRLFVYHASSSEAAVKEQFKIMERRLWLFVTPFSLLTLVFGVLIIFQYGTSWLANSAWLHAKLTLVALFYAYHFYLWHLVKVFAKDENKHSPRFFRFLNEMPVFAFFGIVALAVVKPF
ncbi:CopD family protein [Agaribacter flavus]|uniref:Protoporphyrinogen IX oxidase n=1 Tax=Agaribacter flavus TaxID=1902781 RepID=A0ABV7FUG4_9ALTE